MEIENVHSHWEAFWDHTRAWGLKIYMCLLLLLSSMLSIRFQSRLSELQMFSFGGEAGKAGPLVPGVGQGSVF